MRPPAGAADAALTAVYRRALRRYRAPRGGAPLATVGRGVAVQPSALGPAAGLGLFAARAFPAGALITGMDGAVVGRPGAAWSHLRTLLRGALWLDGLAARPAPRGAGGGSYANDAAGPAGPAGRRNNAVLVVLRDRATAPGCLPLVALRAARDIAPGEEILVAYGRGYWRRFAAAARQDSTA